MQRQWDAERTGEHACPGPGPLSKFSQAVKEEVKSDFLSLLFLKINQPERILMPERYVSGWQILLPYTRSPLTPGPHVHKLSITWQLAHQAVGDCNNPSSAVSWKELLLLPRCPLKARTAQ